MIAVFDSGYGGLTVLKPIIEKLPQYDYLYLGDNARAPYGNHSKENILNFSRQAVDYLFDQGAKLILFACNTASARALRPIQQSYLKGDKETERKILGVLIPVAEQAVEISKNNRIGVVGTKATMNSQAYNQELKKIDQKVKVYSKACPLLVPFIEEDWHKKPEAKSILKKYLLPLKSSNIDTLILGCTHYPLMINDFKKVMGKNVKVLDSGTIVAEKLQDYLNRHPEIEQKLSRGKKRSFLTTDDPQIFKKFVEKHFGMKITTPTQLSLEAC